VGRGQRGRGVGLTHVVGLLVLMVVNHRVVVGSIVRWGHAKLVIAVVGRAQGQVREAVVLHHEASCDAVPVLASVGSVTSGRVCLELVLHA